MGTLLNMSIVSQCFITLIALLFLLGLFAPPGRAEDVFSSLTTLRTLYNKQEMVLSLVENYIAEEKDRLTELQMRIDLHRKQMKKIKENPTSVVDVSHPLVAYSLLRDLHSLAQQVNDTYPADVLDRDLEEAGAKWPNDDDIQGAMLGIMRLQRTYQLSIDDIATGSINGHQAPVTLDGRDFFHMGRLAMERGELMTALSWMERVTSYPTDDIPQSDILYHLAKIYSQMSMPTEALGYIQMAYSYNPGDPKLIRAYETMQRIVNTREDDATDRIYVEPRPGWMETFERVCRDGPSKYVLRDVWCEYQVHTLPYTPYKMEVINPDPWIVVYHDVISNGEAEYFKTLTAPWLHRAGVGNPKKLKPSEGRIGKLKQLSDFDPDPFPKRMSRRVQEITGLVTSHHSRLANAELLTVVNYGIGGHYGTHYDMFMNKKVLDKDEPHLIGSGDRVATFMFYLTDVEAGGATIFPSINVYVPAIKNSALFWYNLHRDGRPDLRTQHAACPVLLGDKWVVTKWIRMGGQLFRRPCGPEKMSTESESQEATASLRRMFPQ